jgi:hypothetical protein
MSLAGKPLDHIVGDIIGIAFRGGATGQAEGGNQKKPKKQENSERIHRMNLEDPKEKAIRDGAGLRGNYMWNS